MMPLKRYNLAAVLLLLLGGYGSAQPPSRPIAPAWCFAAKINR